MPHLDDDASREELDNVEIDIRADGEHRYVVETPGSTGSVVIPQRWLDEWGLTRTSEPQVVRAACELLVGHGVDLRDPLRLDDPSATYDGFERDLALTLGMY